MVKDRPELNSEKERGKDFRLPRIVCIVYVLYLIMEGSMCLFVLFTLTQIKRLLDYKRMQGENLVEILRRLSTARYGIRVSKLLMRWFLAMWVRFDLNTLRARSGQERTRKDKKQPPMI